MASKLSGGYIRKDQTDHYGRVNESKLYHLKMLYSDGNAIYEDSSMTSELTFTQVKALLDNPNNDVKLWNGNYILSPEYSTTQEGVQAIWFNGTTALNSKTYLYRIVINSDNQVRTDEYELAQESQLPYIEEYSITGVNFNVKAYSCEAYGNIVCISLIGDFSSTSITHDEILFSLQNILTRSRVRGVLIEVLGTKHVAFTASGRSGSFIAATDVTDIEIGKNYYCNLTFIKY